MTNKTFTVTGVSKWKDQYKVRFGNDMTQRTKVLTKNNSDIQLISLSHPMTKSEISTFLKSSELYQNPNYRLAIDTADAKYNPSVKVRAKRGRAKKVVTMDSIISSIESKREVA
jgi:hypothetical protein